MLRPSIFGESLFDDWMDGFGFPVFPTFSDFTGDFANTDKVLYGKHAKNMMKTDVREKDGSYEVDIDLPGFKKDEIQLQLENGYLTVSAAKGLDKEEEDQKGKYVRRERYAGSMSRSFYVGDQITEQDVHASYENGILKFSIPKLDKKAVEEKKRYISIEG